MSSYTAEVGLRCSSTTNIELEEIVLWCDSVSNEQIRRHFVRIMVFSRIRALEVATYRSVHIEVIVWCWLLHHVTYMPFAVQFAKNARSFTLT